MSNDQKPSTDSASTSTTNAQPATAATSSSSSEQTPQRPAQANPQQTVTVHSLKKAAEPGQKTFNTLDRTATTGNQSKADKK